MTVSIPPDQQARAVHSRRVMGNTIWLTLSSLGAKALAYAQFVFVVRTFSTHEVGVYAVCLTGVLFAELVANLGLDRVVVREVARLGRGKSKEIFVHSLVLKISASLAAYVLCLGVFWWLYPEIATPYGASLFAFLAYVPISSLARSFESHFTAIEYMVVPALSQLAERVVMLAVAIGAWAGLYDFTVFLAAFPLGGMLRLAIPMTLFWHNPKNSLPFHLSSSQAKDILADSSWLFGVEVMAVAYFRIDIFMLSKMADLRDTGLYQAAYKIFDFGIAMFAGYLTAIFPALAKGRSQLQPRLFFLGALAVFFCFSLPLIVFRQDILLFFKPEYGEAASALACLMLTLPLVYANSLLANFAVATSKVRQLFFVAIPLLAINIALNAWLIPQHGIFGAALATLGSEFVLAMALLIFLKPFTLAPSPVTVMCNKTL